MSRTCIPRYSDEREVACKSGMIRRRQNHSSAMQREGDGRPPKQANRRCMYCSHVATTVHAAPWKQPGGGSSRGAIPERLCAYSCYYRGVRRKQHKYAHDKLQEEAEARLPCSLGPPGFTRDGFLHQVKETSCAEDHMITPNLF